MFMCKDKVNNDQVTGSINFGKPKIPVQSGGDKHALRLRSGCTYKACDKTKL